MVFYAGQMLVRRGLVKDRNTLGLGFKDRVDELA